MFYPPEIIKMGRNHLQKISIYNGEAKILLDYITNLQEKIKYNDLILKALHKYFTEHEEYENDEFLKQLESCTKNDMVWLKRTAGDDNE